MFAVRFTHCIGVSYWNSFVTHCIPEMPVSDLDDSEDEELVYILCELQNPDNDSDDNDVLWSYGVVRAKCEAKATQKGIMDGVYIPPKKRGGGQWHNEVVLTDEHT